MKVSELITLLEKANPDAVVHASDIYEEGIFEITGMIFDKGTVNLTGENND